MEQEIQIINNVLPILFLIALGYWIRRNRFLTASTIDELRKITVNIAMPSVLFISFLNIEFKSSYFILFGFIFSFCIGMIFLGKLIKQKLNIKYVYFPYLTTGFEYGMLGISLFGGAYGLEKIGYIAVTDLGHEIFIWFVFLPLLLMKRDGTKNIKEVAKSFFAAPVVIAILTSILCNLTGGRTWLYQLPVTGGLITTLKFLSYLTVPLILIIVGYGIKIDRVGIRESLLVVIIRLAILLPSAVILNRFLIRNFLGLDKYFETALFTLFILPPPFIVPLYARPDIKSEERLYINNVLALHTIISVSIFILYYMITHLGY
ncbi:MAG: malate permease [Verrucomicrobiota bacterium]|jgi:predicted permease|nr:malate permease [Verrucomicrobiota bacterium]